jgi:hypothetical protein
MDTAINLTQLVQLTGAGSPSFKHLTDGSKEVYRFFEQHLTGLPMIRGDVDEVNGDTQLIASNRFFTSTLEEPNAVSCGLPAGVDLMNALGKFKGGHLIHTDDNSVFYYRKSKDLASKCVITREFSTTLTTI